MRARSISALLVIGLDGALPAAGQPAARGPAEPAPSADDRIKALEADLEDLQSANEDLASELADLKEQLAALRPPASPNALNPQLTVSLNGALRIDDQRVLTPAGVAIDDRPFLRTAEFDARAAADPFTDAVVILAIEDEAGEGYSAELEEAYVVLKRLPVLESAPLGLRLKLGRFRAPIGSNNRLHLHDLPWTTRPLPIARFLGSENSEFFESGTNPVGLDAELLLPALVPGAVMELTAEIVDGGNLAISDGSHTHPGFVGRYNLFFTARDTHDVNLGVSGYYEPGARRAGLVALDAMYKWKPLAAGEVRSVVAGGELFYVSHELGLDEDGDGEAEAERTASPLGAFGYAQLQLSWHLFLGARYDYAQDLTHPSLTTQLAAGYVSYYSSEHVRFRAGYEHRWSDLPADDGRDSFLAEVSVVFGAHPTEPYWVHR